MKFVDGHPNGWKNMTRNNTSSYINQFDSSTFLVSYSFATCSIDGVSGKLKFRVASKGELISKKNLNRITKWHESYIISIFYGWGYNEVNNFCIMSFYHNGIISHTHKKTTTTSSFATHNHRWCCRQAILSNYQCMSVTLMHANN